jgi:hypothetical protein
VANLIKVNCLSLIIYFCSVGRVPALKAAPGKRPKVKEIFTLTVLPKMKEIFTSINLASKSVEVKKSYCHFHVFPVGHLPAPKPAPWVWLNR